MKLHIGNVTFTVATNPGLPPESFAIVSEREVAIWRDGNLLMISRAEYDRRCSIPSQGIDK